MLVSCRECQRQLSSSAAACPHCGAPRPNDVKLLFGILGGLIVGAVFLWWFFTSGPAFFLELLKR